MKMYLKGLLEDLDFSSEVLFTGYIDNVYKYLKKSDIFVLSSLVKGFGMVLVEAIQCGCAIVESNCKFGLLCQVQTEEYFEANEPLSPSEQDMADKILYLLQHQKVRSSFSKL